MTNMDLPISRAEPSSESTGEFSLVAALLALVSPTAMSPLYKYVRSGVPAFFAGALLGSSLCAQSPAVRVSLRPEAPAAPESESAVVVASGNPDYFIEVIDDVSAPASLQTKHGIN